MSDLLRFDYINSLPHPLIAVYRDGWEFPVHDIEVQCGLVRIDVMGKLQVCDIVDFKCLKDDFGVEHDIDTFFVDYEEPPTTEQDKEEVSCERLSLPISNENSS